MYTRTGLYTQAEKDLRSCKLTRTRVNARMNISQMQQAYTQACTSHTCNRRTHKHVHLIDAIGVHTSMYISQMQQAQMQQAYTQACTSHTCNRRTHKHVHLTNAIGVHRSMYILQICTYLRNQSRQYFASVVVLQTFIPHSMDTIRDSLPANREVPTPGSGYRNLYHSINRCHDRVACQERVNN